MKGRITQILVLLIGFLSFIGINPFPVISSHRAPQQIIEIKKSTPLYLQLNSSVSDQQISESRHYSHRSHVSHRSHYSHYSSR